jgi:hypothetical protein
MENNVLKNLLYLNNMDDYKTIDNDKDYLYVKFNKPTDIKSDITNSDLKVSDNLSDKVSDLTSQIYLNNTNDYKTIDKVIAYDRDASDVKCINPNDIKSDIVNSDNTITTKCIKFIKFLGDPTDLYKDECPINSTPLLSQNMCVSQQYDAVCPDGLDKIGNKCYKPCNTNYITVDIQKVNNYVENNIGDKCINNNLNK